MPLSLPWIRVHNARAAGGHSLREFFTYHGIWALGVRPLRRLNLRAKVICVALALGMPSMGFGTWVLVHEQRLLTRAEQRLSGIDLVGAVSALRVELGAASAALESGRPVAGDRRVDVFAELQAAREHALSVGLPVQQPWERARAAIVRAVESAALPAPARREIDQQALAATQQLRDAIIGLTQADADDDPRTHAVASLSTEALPHLQTALALLRRALLGAPMLPLPNAQDPSERMALVNVAAHLGTTEVLFRQALVLRRETDPSADLPATREYLQWARERVLRADGVITAERLASHYGVARQEVHELRLALLATLRSQVSTARDTARDARNLTALALGGTLLIAGFLVYSFFLVVNGGLGQLNLQVSRMAEGDLSARLSPRGGDEVAETMRSMTQALVRLSDLLATVRQGAAGVHQAAQVVANGNAELSRRNGSQAQCLDGVVAGIEAYTRQLQRCGQEVELVVGAVQSLRLDAARNRKQMLRLQDRMTQLRTGSREIGDIVRLIDSLAFRTNILALNASVEASKAGESGRGFAIVAQEVRSLAMRSAASAQQIGEIVQRSTEDVELSVSLVDETSHALSSADSHIDQIHETVDRVAVMTRQGESDASGLVAAVRELKTGSDDVQHLVAELATASGQLRRQGDRLLSKIGQFNLS